MTAEEFLDNLSNEAYIDDVSNKIYFPSQVEEAMIEFAKYHVEKALESASKSGKLLVDGVEYEEYSIRAYDTFYRNTDIYVDKESVKEAYPLNNIK